jgi:HB1/ASXL restriction endonuclease-like protein with HTH domain/restriction endonuclease
MTFTDAACEVLRMSGKPLHYKEITEIAIEKNLLSHVGKSPEVTMGARLAATLKKGGDENPLVRVKPGVFALREWDDDTIKRGLDALRQNGKKDDGDDEEPVTANGSDDEAVVATEPAEIAVFAPPPAPPPLLFDPPPTPPAYRPPPLAQRAPAPITPARAEMISFDDDDDLPPAPDEAMRAEIAAGAAEVFAEEDDDDQPILGRPADEEPEPGGEGRRRRRRRRRRGSRGNEQEGERPQGGGGGMPTFTATPAFDASDEPTPRGPQVIEVSGGEGPALDALAGRDLSDAVAAILQTFDRTVGAVSLRQICETAQRRGRLGGDIQVTQAQIAAAVRADNARRYSAGMRPRFRMAGGRVGLTDWLLDGELARFEREALSAIGRYRDAARRAFARKCAELPGHAFVELSLLVLERVGVTKLRPVKFPGASGAEAHFTGVLHAPAGQLAGQLGLGEGVRLGIVVRKDGRDLGRERVTELRGSAHHYDGATMGWILTSGQVLSGAREEATSPGGVMPVTILDGGAIAKLCEEYAVAVVRAEHPICIPDVDLFEALRSS